MEKNKTLLIVEQVNSNLTISENQDVIYLEGVFTEFKVRNRNGRIYEANDFIPKMNELLPKVENHTLLGELDHPVNFDVSLKNVSHVIESLVYDQENDRVIGKIRLLNSEAGKQAQALVKDGIPLHISSRAAGQINPQTGKVTLERLFTYDLVADPGFENAELKRVNEAYGFGELDNVYIYECNELNTKSKKENNILKPMNTSINESENVNVKDFQKYTEYIAGILENVKNSIDDIKKQMSVNESKVAQPVTVEDNSDLREYVNYLAEQIQNVSNHNDYLAEQLQKNCDHNDYLAEQVEKTIDFADYLSENINNSIEYSKYLSEKLDENFQHNDYLAEQLQKNCDHNDYLAEQLQKTGEFANYLAENLQKNCDHNDYLAEQLEKTTDYADYLAENLKKNFEHNDYLAEQLNNSFKYNDYLAEQVQQIANSANVVNENTVTVEVEEPAEVIAESKVEESTEAVAESKVEEPAEVVTESETEKPAEVIAESKVEEPAEVVTESETEKPAEVIAESKVEEPVQVEKQSNDIYKSAISEKLDAILKAQTESIKEDNFLNFLSEGRKEEFKSMNPEMQQMITEAMNLAHVKNDAQANIVWKSVYESKKGLDIVENMPTVYKERWNGLSNKRKTEILNEAKYYNIKSTNDIEYFWSTRDLREETVILERVDTDSASKWNQNANVQADHIASIMGRTKRNMRGW